MGKLWIHSLIPVRASELSESVSDVSSSGQENAILTMTDNVLGLWGEERPIDVVDVDSSFEIDICQNIDSGAPGLRRLEPFPTFLDKFNDTISMNLRLIYILNEYLNQSG